MDSRKLSYILILALIGVIIWLIVLIANSQPEQPKPTQYNGDNYVVIEIMQSYEGFTYLGKPCADKFTIKYWDFYQAANAYYPTDTHEITIYGKTYIIDTITDTNIRLKLSD